MIGKTGKKGGQFGNDNASKNRLDLETNPNASSAFDRLHVKFFKGLDDSQHTTLLRYSGGDYAALNDTLRNKSTPDESSVRANIRTSFRSFAAELNRLMKPLPVDAVVWRGIHANVRDKYKTGDVFKDRGFVSTSINLNVANHFIGRNPNGPRGTIFKIRVPAGARAAFLNRDTVDGREQEILLAPGTHFKVLDSEGSNFMHLQVVPTPKKLIAKAGNTGQKGGQYHNDNAAKTHYNNFIEQYPLRLSPELTTWHDAMLKKQTTEKKESYFAGPDYYTHWTATNETINAHLRSGTPLSNTAAMQDVIDNMMKTFTPLDRSVQVYRGAARNFGKKGAVFTDKGFVSTTLHHGTAQFFAKRGFTDTPTVAMFAVPKGTPAIFSNYADERELILPPKTKFRIKSDPKLIGGVYYQDLEIVK